MFRCLLVPTDLAESTRDVLDLAVRLAARGAGRVSLLHVVKRIPTLDAGAPAPEVCDLRAFYATLEGVARRRLCLLANSAHACGAVEVLHHVTVGKRADEIARFAQSIGADLIILRDGATVGRAPGSLNYRISARVLCPVLLVK